MEQQTRRSFSDVELLGLLHRTESEFVERKTRSDSEDWLKVMTAFANSCPYSDAGVLFIGAYDDGTIQVANPPQNLDQLQITLAKLVKRIFPPIPFDCKGVSEEGRECLAVIVHGSENRPHFVGAAYIRVGSQTLKASESQYAELIAQRNLKTYDISLWKGKTVTVELHYPGRSRYFAEATIVECNAQYVVTLAGDTHVPYPLERVRVSKDFERNRLKLEVTES